MRFKEIIDCYQLEPLPQEGGYFRRIYTHQDPSSQHGKQKLASAIYFLITANQFSAMHRLPSDELFHFYEGHYAEMLQLAPDGSGKLIRLGHRFEHGETPLALAPANHWQGLALPHDAPEHAYAFFGVSVHPEFVWESFELGQREALCQQYPDWKDAINARTRS